MFDPTMFFAVFAASVLSIGAVGSGWLLWTGIQNLRDPIPEPQGYVGRVSFDDPLWVMKWESEKDRMTCPMSRGGCGATRCWDWKHNSRPCGQAPTRATSTVLVGRHDIYNVKPVLPSWTPLPKSRFARSRPHLWSLVAGHCQILITPPIARSVPA